MVSLKRITREKSKLRMSIEGPSGSGKSYTALRLGFALAAAEAAAKGTPIRLAAIDSENGSLAKYAGYLVDDIRWEWEGVELTRFTPDDYMAAMLTIEQYKYDVMLIDSLSHEWMGTGGVLDMVSKKTDKNKFMAWNGPSQLHQRLIESIIRSPCHIIATMRSKTEYVLENDSGGRQVPRKVGMAAVQREGTEYEFDIACTLDLNHLLNVTKTRCPVIDRKQVTEPGADFMQLIIHWLNEGNEPAPRELLDAAAMRDAPHQAEQPAAGEQKPKLSPIELMRQRAAQSQASNANQETQADAPGAAGVVSGDQDSSHDSSASASTPAHSSASIAATAHGMASMLQIGQLMAIARRAGFDKAALEGRLIPKYGERWYENLPIAIHQSLSKSFEELALSKEAQAKSADEPPFSPPAGVPSASTESQPAAASHMVVEKQPGDMSGVSEGADAPSNEHQHGRIKEILIELEKRQKGTIDGIKRHIREKYNITRKEQAILDLTFGQAAELIQHLKVMEADVHFGKPAASPTPDAQHANGNGTGNGNATAAKSRGRKAAASPS